MARRDFIIHTPEEIERIRVAARMTAIARDQIAEQVHPGMTTKELDDLAGAIIRASGGVSAFHGYHGYPGNVCISVNDEVVHGIGNPFRVLNEGDVVSIDVGIQYNGAMGDTAKTVYVGKEIPPAEKRLLEGTRLSLEAGIKAAKNGGFVRDISKAVERVAKEHSLGVVRDFVGHGCGIALHEPPEVPNFAAATKGPRLVPGMVLCIEPMLNLGSYKIYVEKDQWTVRTADGSKSAHFEHMILITEGQVEVLTRV
ncbi:MAG: type I methionyl aminopeptidase [Lentisphaeria bacterium]|nr:type I methionyl aminopeptidase [Lentisphaeria bacterium]